MTDTREETGKTGKKFLLPLLILLGLLLIALVLLRIFEAEEKDVTPLSTVSTAKAETGNLTEETALIGSYLPADLYYVIPQTSGKVTKIFVKAGDTVRKGDKICTIDNEKQIEAAKLSLDSAKLQVTTLTDSVALAETNLERMEALYATGDISKQSYEQVKSAYDQAVAGLEGAKVQVDAAKLSYDTQVEFSTVTAPADGTVKTTDMTLNNYVTQSSPVAVITGTGEGKVTFSITDRLLSSVHAGDIVRVEKQGSVYEGTVTDVAGLPGATTGLYEVEAEVEAGGAIPTGASVKVYFVSARSENALLIPAGSIYYDGGKTYVYTVSFEEGEEEASAVLSGNRAATVHKKEIGTGLTDGEKTEVTSGLDGSEDLIISWTAQLYEGARVQVLGGETK